MRRLFFFVLLGLFSSSSVWAFSSFTVKDIRIEGLQRISEGSVYNYLSVNVGDTLDEAESVNAIQSLFKTGFFQDITLEKSGDTLIVTVVERPSISDIEISGNDDITTEQLTDALKYIGLEKGRIFNSALLDKIELELQRQYFSQGKYGVKIKSSVEKLERNRVNINIEISEGDVAKIKRITIVGNEVFDDETVKDQFTLSPPTFFSFFTNNDSYAQQKLRADLENLRSYYLDRGYINFSIDSSQVSITPEKEDIFISINISEGDQYTVGDVKFSGELIMPEEELKSLVSIAPGDIFSRKMITESNARLSERLGDMGYAFANINPIPDIDKTNKRVDLTFFIDPGKRIYVRKINITGNQKTNDEVLRREMRQMEGGWLSTQKVNRSRIRLQRLGFFDDVNVETPVVAGASDQVDVNYNVIERRSGNFIAGISYSGDAGILLNASISENNFLGTGKRVSTNIDRSAARTVYSFGYTDPYYTLDGVSRGFRVFSRKTDVGRVNISGYTSNSYGGSVSYGFPLNEYDTARVELGAERTSIFTNPDTPQAYRDFLDANSNEFNIFRLSTSWSHDTRNRAIFADKGGLLRLSAEAALPGSELNFYKLSARQSHYLPLNESLTLFLKGEVGYGDRYGETTALPFFENYYAGGGFSIRGFKANTLGLRDEIKDRALGGAFKAVGNIELIFPPPFMEEKSKSVRLSAFFDIGNVFPDYNDFDVDEMRHSAGISMIWYTPMAPMTFSWAKPLNDKEGDKIERFQFSFGTFF